MKFICICIFKLELVDIYYYLYLYINFGNNFVEIYNCGIMYNCYYFMFLLIKLVCFLFDFNYLIMIKNFYIE